MAEQLVKCLIWDLDNTVWDGTLLEDGAVALRPGVREAIETLDARGILHSVASKNDDDLAWRRLEELGIAEFFLSPMIHWGAKSGSVTAIGEALKFAEATLAFIDDQPAERAEVNYVLPAVRCYTAEQVAELATRPEFSPGTVTVDSRRRRQMYRANLARDEEKTAFAGPDEDFLRSLELVMQIDRAGDEELSRVEELTLRTSQMNATGVHYSDATLRALVDDPAHEVLTAAMSDRFGPHGAVGVLLIERHPAVWHLKLLATSCRVVSFGAGSAILNWISDQAARAGVHLVADFRKTERNRMMEVAYRFAGYADDPCACRDEVGGDRGDIAVLHLVPARHDVPDTLTLDAVDLSTVPQPIS